MNDRPFLGFADFCKLLHIQSNIKNIPITSVCFGPPLQPSSNFAPWSQNLLNRIMVLVLTNKVTRLTARVLMLLLCKTLLKV